MRGCTSCIVIMQRLCDVPLQPCLRTLIVKPTPASSSASAPASALSPIKHAPLPLPTQHRISEHHVPDIFVPRHPHPHPLSNLVSTAQDDCAEHTASSMLPAFHSVPIRPFSASARFAYPHQPWSTICIPVAILIATLTVPQIATLSTTLTALLMAFLSCNTDFLARFKHLRFPAIFPALFSTLSLHSSESILQHLSSINSTALHPNRQPAYHFWTQIPSHGYECDFAKNVDIHKWVNKICWVIRPVILIVQPLLMTAWSTSGASLKKKSFLSFV